MCEISLYSGVMTYKMSGNISVCFVIKVTLTARSEMSLANRQVDQSPGQANQKLVSRKTHNTRVVPEQPRVKRMTVLKFVHVTRVTNHVVKGVVTRCSACPAIA